MIKVEQSSKELIREQMVHHRAASISHHEATIAELANNKAFAQEYKRQINEQSQRIMDELAAQAQEHGMGY